MSTEKEQVRTITIPITEYIKVKAVKDESSHWYLIPNELVENFYKDDEDELDSFDSLYGKYRTGGDLNIIQLYIKNK